LSGGVRKKICDTNPVGSGGIKGKINQNFEESLTELFKNKTKKLCIWWRLFHKMFLFFKELNLILKFF